MSNPNPPNQFVTKMTEEAVTAICDSIEKANAPETAVIAASIHLRTYRRWMKEGKEWLDNHDPDEVPSAEALFVMRVEKAIAIGEQRLVTGAVDAQDPRINLEILARRFPRTWGRRERIDIGHPEEQMWELATKDLSFLPLDDVRHLQRIFRMISEHRAGGDVIEMPRRRELEA